jgi:hypothetical protein
VLTEKSDDLLNFAGYVNNEISQLQNKSQKLLGTIAGLDDNILLQQICISQFQEELERIRFELGIESKRNTIESDDRSSQIKDFEDVSEAKCRYGAVPYSKCQHFIANLSTLIVKQKQWEQSTKRLFSDLAKEEQIDYICKMDQDLRARREEYLLAVAQKSNMEREKSAKQQEHAQVIFTINNVNPLLRTWLESEDVLSGKVKNSESERLKGEISDLDAAITDIRGKVDVFRNDYEKNLSTLTSIYNGLMKDVLDERFSGTVSLNSGELKFGIKEDAGCRGEAVETLSVVLADIAAMMSAGKIGFHPGFLLHDSPREADLAEDVYKRIFTVINSHVTLAGGPEGAPFQYIVTTTSAPPREIQKADVIRAELSGNPEGEMLFGRSLRKAEAEQMELFSGIKR